MSDYPDVVRYVSERTHAFDGSHDVCHALRVAENASHLCRNPELHKLCVVSALTHDTCDQKYFPDKDEECNRLYDFLTTLDYFSESEAATVRDVVREVSYSKLRRCGPPTHLDRVATTVWRIVSDADMLEAMGIVGTFRTIMYQGHTRKCLDNALTYMDVALSCCDKHMGSDVAIQEARERKRTMAVMVEEMRKQGSTMRNVALYCLVSGVKSKGFETTISDLRTKRWWPSSLEDALRIERERFRRPLPTEHATSSL